MLLNIIKETKLLENKFRNFQHEGCQLNHHHVLLFFFSSSPVSLFHLDFTADIHLTTAT